MPTSNVPSRSFTCPPAVKARFMGLLMTAVATFCTWASAFTPPPTRINRARRRRIGGGDVERCFFDRRLNVSK